MFIRKKILNLLSGILIAGMLFAGCSNGSDKSDPAKSSSSANINTFDSNEKVKLTIWWAGQDKFKQPLVDAIKRFNQKYPNIEIAPQWQPTFDYYDKYKISLSGKKAPDIVKIDHVFVQALGYNKQIVNLTELGAKDIEGQFVPSTWKANMYKDIVFALPFDANTMAIMYNKDLLDKAGIQPPKTLDELKNNALAIKNLKIDGTYGYTMPVISGASSSGYLSYQFVSWVARNGGSILSDDWTKCTLDQPEVISALQQMNDMIKSGAAPANVFLEAEFYNGKVGMIEMGPWNVPMITRTDAPAKFNVSPLVTLKEGISPVGSLGLYSLAISQQCKKIPQAYEFLKFLATDKEFQTAYSKATYLMPSLQSSYDDPFFDGDIWKVYIDQLKNTAARPGTPAWPEIDKYITIAIQEALTGTKTPEQALKDANVKCNQVLAKIK